ncbi:hypothetical protein NHX12_012948 [Muraenolepis orangiensis]|uniref:HAUS augmin-like complex subunit 7 n=1 Tax=Muraenolepis orangiensis TaxID=630683 RepID=A0A9Q0DDV2_9TELE|nr:hypothetical protein NHX12_012948 [Muraenolepis orangiensis]
MAAALKEEHQLAQKVYAALQAASCPLLVEGHLGEAESVHQLLCTPSQHRTGILAWVCTTINPKLEEKLSVMQPNDPKVQVKEMAMLGRDLMLCKADDLDLIRGHAKPLRQLQFLEELLYFVPGWENFSESEVDGEALLEELFADENRAYFTHMLMPTLNPLPAHITSSFYRKQNQSPVCRPGPEESDDVAALLESAGSVLKELQSECEFLHGECESPAAFSPRVAVSDLRNLMADFSNVYETGFRDYCHREAPQLRTETLVFQRVHQLLLACNTELNMLEEASLASAAVAAKTCQLETQPSFWSRGEKRTLPDQLKEVTQLYKHFLSQYSPEGEK